MGMSCVALSIKLLNPCNDYHYSRVRIRIASIIDTIQDGERRYEKLSSHVRRALHMLIALRGRVTHSE
jgi:hypothetical protein